ncbi:hypothetical protein L208DRAFT_1197245, partial [Tricholoma matsutake]
SRIHPGTYRTELINNACVIIWEELPSTNIAVIECANSICQQIKCSACPFGGIPFIGLGDFQQIAPVIQGQGPIPALSTSIKLSLLWHEFKVHTLDHPHHTGGDPEYTAFVNHIGEDHTHPETSLQLLQCVNTLNDA